MKTTHGPWGSYEAIQRAAREQFRGLTDAYGRKPVAIERDHRMQRARVLFERPAYEPIGWTTPGVLYSEYAYRDSSDSSNN